MSVNRHNMWGVTIPTNHGNTILIQGNIYYKVELNNIPTLDLSQIMHVILS